MSSTENGGDTINPASLTPKLPHVTHFEYRHGTIRWRYRRNGLTVALGSEWGSDLFMLKIEAAKRGERLTKEHEEYVLRSVPASGSLSAMVDSWYQSQKFQRLADSTKYGYRKLTEALRMEYGHKLVKGLTCQDIQTLMATKAHKPNAANHNRRILSFLLDRAKQHGLVAGNVARDVNKLEVRSNGYHTWSEAEIAAFLDVHKAGTTPHLVLTLMLYTGQDVLM
jgi:hypothetical protein